MLELFVRDHAGQFALCLVVGWNNRLRDEMLDSLALALGSDMELVRVDWLRQVDPSPIDVLDKALAPEPKAPARALVLSNTEYVEALREESRDHPALYPRLNILRDGLTKRFPLPWIIWLTPPAFTSMALRAPDFYDFRNYSIFLDEPTADVSVTRPEAIQDREIADDGLSLSEQEKNAFGAEIEKMERIGDRDRQQGEYYIYLLKSLARGYLGDRGIPQAVHLLGIAVEEAERIGQGDDASKAELLGIYARTLSLCGRWADALIAARTSEAIYRNLAALNGFYLASWAGSLNNLSVLLSNNGQFIEASRAMHEAVDIFKDFATKNPDRYQSDYAGGLSNLANRLLECGDTEGAFRVGQEAIAIYKKLTKINSARFEPRLASALNNYSAQLASKGDLKGALQAIREAVDIRRRLAGDNTDIYEPDLASSLSYMATRLYELGDTSAALEVSREAVAIYRRWAEIYPGLYEWPLAISLNNMAGPLAGMDDITNAVAVQKESVDIRRRLAARNPQRFESELADSLGMLGAIYEVANNTTEAIAAYRQGLDLIRPRAEADPNSPAGKVYRQLEEALDKIEVKDSPAATT